MPRYDYICLDCGEQFEIRMSMADYSEGVKPGCQACGSDRAARTFAAVGVLTGSRSGGSSASACGPTGFT